MTRFRIYAMLVTLLASAHAAHANGRFPKSVNVHIQPGDDQTILLGVTFGLLISRDGGDSFRWVCEEAIGYGGTFDPDFALAADGSIFATTFEGLRVSRDGGCTWDNLAGPLEGHWIGDVEIGPQGNVWAVTSSGGMANDVFVSSDNGESFTSKNMLQASAWWKSVRIAPGDNQRVYLSGYLVAQSTPDGGMVGPAAMLYRSDDGGDTWVELPVDGFDFGVQPILMIEAVAPDNPDVVFARTVTDASPLGNAMYRSTDAGASWTKILDIQATIRSFLIRQNGDLLVGMVNNTTDNRVFVSRDGGDTWIVPEYQPQMCCLAENSAGQLYSCGANWEPNYFALGTSTDAEQWTKVFRFNEMDAPLACPASSIQSQVCAAKRWPALCEQFACNRPDAGPGGGGDDAGTGAVDGGGGMVENPGDRDTGGCCDARANPVGSLVLAGMVALLLLLVLRRRRVSRAGGGVEGGA